jgi:hypothetical protein
MENEDVDPYEEMYPEYVDTTKRAWLAEGAFNPGPDEALNKKLRDYLAKPVGPEDDKVLF